MTRNNIWNCICVFESRYNYSFEHDLDYHEFPGTISIVSISNKKTNLETLGLPGWLTTIRSVVSLHRIGIVVSSNENWNSHVF